MIPHVLDDLMLAEVARGDTDLIDLLLSYDAAGQVLVVPVLAAAAAYRHYPSADAADSLRGIPELDHATSAPVGDVTQAMRLVEIAAKTGLDVCAEHVGAPLTNVSPGLNERVHPRVSWAFGRQSRCRHGSGSPAGAR